MTTIQMPQLGETIIEGTILKWLKQEGDSVARDEPLFEISTDKVDTEVPSPVAGTVTKILVEEGATVPVGTVVMEVDDGSGAARRGAGGVGPRRGATPARPRSRPRSRRRAAAAEPPAAAAPATVTSLPDRGPRSAIVSPLVRRLAAEHGIDLAAVAGTGSGGRITKKDVEAAIAAGGAGGGAPAAPAATVTPLRAPAPAVAAAPGQGDTVEPMSHIRTAIAQHMVGVDPDHRPRVDDGRGQRRPPRAAADRVEGRVPRAARREPHVPAVRRSAPRSTR